MTRFSVLLSSLVLIQPLLSGCGGLDHGRGLDEDSILRARAAYRDRVSLVSVQTQDDPGDKWPEERASDRAGSTFDVVVAELIAIGPGLFVQGLGHRFRVGYIPVHLLACVPLSIYIFPRIPGCGTDIAGVENGVLRSAEDQLRHLRLPRV